MKKDVKNTTKMLFCETLKTDVIKTSRKHHPVRVLEESIRTFLGHFSKSVKHSITKFLVFSCNTLDEVTLAKYDSNSFYTETL